MNIDISSVFVVVYYHDHYYFYRLLYEGDAEFRRKVDRLISLGLLKFQS
jgi:hypothetical protein